MHWLDAGSDELLAALQVLNGYDIDLAADQTRLASCLRDALTSIAPALERVVGDRLHQAAVRDLLARYPTLTALRAAGQSRIERTVRRRSPRIAAKVTAAIAAAVTDPLISGTDGLSLHQPASLEGPLGRRDSRPREPHRRCQGLQARIDGPLPDRGDRS